MKLKKKLKTAMAVFMFVTSIASTAYAAEKVSLIKLDITPDEDSYDFKPGHFTYEIEARTDDDRVRVTRCKYTKNGNKKKDVNPDTRFNIDITVKPYEGFEFTDDVSVELKGAEGLKVNDVSKSRVTISAKTRPFLVLPNPTGIELDGNTLKWDKVDYAKKYSIIVKYIDSKDREKQQKMTSSSNKINIGKYNKNGSSIETVSIKAMGKHDGYIADSDYVDESGDPDGDFDYGEYNFYYKTAGNSNRTSNAAGTLDKSSGNGPAGPGLPQYSANSSSQTIGNNEVAGTWTGDADTWSYTVAGMKKTGWLMINPEEWYYFGNDGIMKTSWQFIDGNWYYFNTLHDGYFGKMLSGIQKIGEKEYYFEKNHNGFYGVMLKNTEIEGYKIAADGTVSR